VSEEASSSILPWKHRFGEIFHACPHATVMEEPPRVATWKEDEGDAPRYI
jgi:hypothetical protein